MIAILDERPIPIKIQVAVEPDYPAKRTQPPREIRAVRLYELIPEASEPVYRFVGERYEWAE